MIKNLFLSIGAMKAGTTWLYEQLNNHPGIYFTPEKEVHYFANINAIGNQLSHENRIKRFNQVISKITFPANIKNLEKIYWYSRYAYPNKINDIWYQSLFSENPGKKYCADFSNLYAMLDDRGWSRVRENCQNLKVIYILRDPINRMWSHYKFHLKWIGKEDEVLSLGKEYFINQINSPALWEPAEYHKTIDVLKKKLNENEYKIFYSEDIHANPDKYIYQIEEFLEIRHIEYNKEKSSKRINKTKDYKIPDDWAEILFIKLQPIYAELQSRGLLHENWNARFIR